VLYCVTYQVDGETRQAFVETDSFDDAVALWRHNLREEHQLVEVDPVAVTELTEEPVLRSR